MVPTVTIEAIYGLLSGAKQWGDIAVKGSATLTWNIALSECYQLLATPDTAGGAKYITEIGYINGTGANIYVSYATSASAGNRLIHWLCMGKR